MAQPIGTIVNTPFQGIVRFGLPQFVSSFFEQKPAIPPITTTAACGSVSFASPVLYPATGYSLTGSEWNFGDPLSGNSNTSSVSSPTHLFSANGTYTVKLVLHYPCGADTAAITVSVTGLPALGITGRPVVCKGESSLLEFSGAGSYVLASSPVPQGSVVVQPSVTTVYTLTGTDTGTGCQGSKAFTITVLPCLGLEAGNGGKGIHIYPNPSSGNFTVEADKATAIKITDMLGRNVFIQIIGQGTTQVSLEKMPDGLFFLTANSAAGQQTFKLVKKRD
jgi:hypothetical protein